MLWKRRMLCEGLNNASSCLKSAASACCCRDRRSFTCFESGQMISHQAGLRPCRRSCKKVPGRACSSKVGAHTVDSIPPKGAGRKNRALLPADCKTPCRYPPWCRCCLGWILSLQWRLEAMSNCAWFRV